MVTEFAHAVNYTMSFGCTVLPEDINKQREWLKKADTSLSLWDIEIDKESSDEVIANYLGLENYRDFLLTEAVDMEMEEHHVYNKEDTERLSKEYQQKLKGFREANKLNKSQEKQSNKEVSHDV